ncbi:MAG: site-2 protease family protein [Pirellulales bacterium]
MSSNPQEPGRPAHESSEPPRNYVDAEVVEPTSQWRPPQKSGFPTVPAVLYVLTWISTSIVGGLTYSTALLFTLTAHELGHFLQARRYRVRASWPYFIPVPLPPIGTMGAVIGMPGGLGDRRSLFDIAITGPLAGLIPAIVFSIVGLSLSEVHVVDPRQPRLSLGEPLLFKLFVYQVFGSLPEGHDVFLHPLAFAGWVGIFITALNLIPVSQLDGGHIFYALLGPASWPIAWALLIAAAAAVVIFGAYQWMLLIVLVFLFGPAHPPTANDRVPLGPTRTVLGWLSLAFVIVGFTPQPFIPN